MELDCFILQQHNIFLADASSNGNAGKIIQHNIRQQDVFPKDKEYNIPVNKIKTDSILLYYVFWERTKCAFDLCTVFINTRFIMR